MFKTPVVIWRAMSKVTNVPFATSVKVVRAGQGADDDTCEFQDVADLIGGTSATSGAMPMIASEISMTSAMIDEPVAEGIGVHHDVGFGPARRRRC